jgi:hypothetical protein
MDAAALSVVPTPDFSVFGRSSTFFARRSHFPRDILFCGNNSVTSPADAIFLVERFFDA